MASEKEWRLLMAVAYLLLEEQKVEKNLPFLTNQEVNTSIYFKDIKKAIPYLDGLFNIIAYKLKFCCTCS